MQTIIGGSQSGKTTKLFEWLKEHDKRILIVVSQNEKFRLIKQFVSQEERENSDLPEWTNRVMTYYEFLEKKSLINTPGGQIGIDDADAFLHQLFHRPVAIISITGESTTEPEK